jgi:DNA (cytosine-5)-methyltransferase 1
MSKKMTQKRKLRILDTFAGAGGFSLGFEMAGFEVAGAIELDSWACDTYKFNNPKAIVVNRDISTIQDEEVIQLFGKENIDVILGGPPCQGFSICNKKNGDPKDPRNSLFQEFIRIGKLLKPSIMIMENVPNLIKAKTEQNEFVIDIICRELEDLGFFVNYQILEATHYGVPQIRKRLVVIATRFEIKNPFPIQTHTNEITTDLLSTDLIPCPTLWDAISDLPVLAAREGAEECDYKSEASNEYQKMLRKGSKKIHNHKAMNHSKRVVERFESMKSGDSVSDVPHHLKPLRRNTQEISDRLYDQNNRRMFPDRPCHTIPASFYANFVHPYQDRNFTAREGARIQSFPDWYVFKGKPTVVSQKLLQREERFDDKHLGQYNQIGNAVPPLMAKAIALNIKKQLG